MGKIDQIAQPVILFDGVCNLCNSSINFVIDRDKQHRFKFASLQSQLGEEVARSFKGNTSLDSIILYQEGKILHKSDAVLEVARHLGALWPLLYVFKILPVGFRDWVYGIIAKNRYRWFGKSESCRIPTPELRDRFLD